MIEKVDQSHIKVLQEFKVEKIWNALRRQAYLKKLPAILYNKVVPNDILK